MAAGRTCHPIPAGRKSGDTFPAPAYRRERVARTLSRHSPLTGSQPIIRSHIYESVYLAGSCAVERRCPRVRNPPGNCRSSRKQSERSKEVTNWTGTSMAKGRLGRLSEHAGRNASERRAGLETGNAEADPPLIRGRLAAVGKRATRAPIGSAGVLAVACVQEGDSSNTGSPDGGAHAPTGNPRGPAWAGGVAERLVVPGKPGNAGGGKGPQFERGATRRQGHGDWRKPNSFRKRSETPEGATCESEGVSRLPILFVERQGVARQVRIPGCVQPRQRG